MDEPIWLLARAIELLAALRIGLALVGALFEGGAARLHDAGLRAMRHRLAQGSVSALGLISAASLLKIGTLRSWSAVGLFAAVLALRTLLKQVLAREVRLTEARQGG